MSIKTYRTNSSPKKVKANGPKIRYPIYVVDTRISQITKCISGQEIKDLTGLMPHLLSRFLRHVCLYQKRYRFSHTKGSLAVFLRPRPMCRHFYQVYDRVTRIITHHATLVDIGKQISISCNHIGNRFYRARRNDICIGEDNRYRVVRTPRKVCMDVSDHLMY